MERTEADRLVAELGDRLGIAGLKLDGSGTCTLFIDEGKFIPTLGHNPGAGSIDMMVCIDDLVPNAAQLSSLMAANFGWTDGACFAVEPSSGALVVQRRCTPHQLGNGLLPHLEALIGVAEAASTRLRRIVPATDLDDEGIGALPGGMLRA